MPRWALGLRSLKTVPEPSDEPGGKNNPRTGDRDLKDQGKHQPPRGCQAAVKALLLLALRRFALKERNGRMKTVIYAVVSRKAFIDCMRSHKVYPSSPFRVVLGWQYTNQVRTTDSTFVIHSERSLSETRTLCCSYEVRDKNAENHPDMYANKCEVVGLRSDVHA